MLSDIDVVVDSVLKRLESEKSRRAYKDDWARYVRWLEENALSIVDAKPRHIEAHLNSLKDKKFERSTCGRALSVIRKMYAALVRDEVLKENPAREVENPKFTSVPHTPYLRQDEVSRLFDVPALTWQERRDRLCVLLLFGLGLRRAEIARMCFEDFKNGSVSGVMKGNKPFHVGVPPWLQEEVKSWVQFAKLESGPVLPCAENDLRAVSDYTVYRIVTGFAKKAGLKISPHGLRRSNITILGELGVSLKDRQLAVGHSSSVTTERYDRARDASKNAPGQLLMPLIFGKKK